MSRIMLLMLALAAAHAGAQPESATGDPSAGRDPCRDGRAWALVVGVPGEPLLAGERGWIPGERVATAPPFANEDHIAFAGTYDSSNNGGAFFAGPWGPVQQRILMRLTVCPGDYDRDGDVDQDDADLFDFAWQSSVLYADWNFDGAFIQLPNVDQIKFDAEHANACASP